MSDNWQGQFKDSKVATTDFKLIFCNRTDF